MCRQNDTDMVTISKELYERLCERNIWLSCLEAAGVDNWEGYSYAQELRDDAEEDEQ